MSIKSDKWIKKMSLEHEMIKPFSEGQIRLDDNGNKLISFLAVLHSAKISKYFFT